MSGEYRHLVIARELLTNPRRTIKRNPPRPKRDPKAHATALQDSLTKTIQHAKARQTGTAGRYIFKVQYDGSLDFANLKKHGIEFVSQEGREMCVAFGTEEGLDRFADHLKTLGLEESVTHKQILEAICGFDNWTADDRSSWALKHIGLPKEEEFSLDIELWPFGTSIQPNRRKLRDEFEQWMKAEGIIVLDRVNLDSLLMYRVKVSLDQANNLLEHLAVRLVDLPPVMGISYQQLNRDVNELVGTIASPPQDAAMVCILDSGLASNHPLLGLNRPGFLGDSIT